MDIQYQSTGGRMFLWISFRVTVFLSRTTEVFYKSFIALKADIFTTSYRCTQRRPRQRTYGEIHKHTQIKKIGKSVHHFLCYRTRSIFDWKWSQSSRSLPWMFSRRVRFDWQKRPEHLLLQKVVLQGVDFLPRKLLIAQWSVCQAEISMHSFIETMWRFHFFPSVVMFIELLLNLVRLPCFSILNVWHATIYPPSLQDSKIIISWYQINR